MLTDKVYPYSIGGLFCQYKSLGFLGAGGQADISILYGSSFKEIKTILNICENAGLNQAKYQRKEP